MARPSVTNCFAPALAASAPARGLGLPDAAGSPILWQAAGAGAGSPGLPGNYSALLSKDASDKGPRRVRRGEGSRSPSLQFLLLLGGADLHHRWFCEWPPEKRRGPGATWNVTTRKRMRDPGGGGCACARELAQGHIGALAGFTVASLSMCLLLGVFEIILQLHL